MSVIVSTSFKNIDTLKICILKNKKYIDIENIYNDYENAYISYHSALEYYGVKNQTFYEVYVICIIVQYNSFIKASNIVKEAFSTMDIYLKKRWELIPNIVEVVKGYANHEK